jgi:hypothetical protein
MKGIYVIAIGFLASSAVSAASLDRNQPEQSVSNEDTFADIAWKCPYPERFPMNTTTNLPHEYDCTKFYKCDVGKGVEQSCPLMIKGDSVTRLHYNRLLQVCDWPWQAGCTSCPLKNPDGTYPSSSRINYGPDNCQYYECRNGEPIYNTCPPGTCFSRTCQACVPNAIRAGGNCEGGPTPTNIPPIRCVNGDKRPHDCDCGKYYMCDNEEWYPENCPGGAHFSPTRKTCLPPDEAGCIRP